MFALKWDYTEFTGEYYRVLTSGFLHSQNDYSHIVMNMLSLYIFGIALEQMMGMVAVSACIPALHRRRFFRRASFGRSNCGGCGRIRRYLRADRCLPGDYGGSARTGIIYGPS